MRARAWGWVLLLLLVGGAARAEDPAGLSANERTRRSKAHFDLGRAHFNLGEFEAAMTEFEQGYRLKPLPLFLYNAAHSARRAGHPAKAVELFRRYLQVNPGASERKEVERAIAELDHELAAQKEPQNPPQNEIQNPPQKEPQSPPQNQTQTVPQNEPQSPPPPIAPPPAPAPRAAEPTAAPVTVPAPGPMALTRLARPRAWYRDWVGWAITTVGTFAFAVGVIDFGLTYSRYSAYDPMVGAAGHTAQKYDDARSAASRLPVDIAVFSLGAAAIVGGVVRFALVARSAKHDRFSLVPTGLGAALIGRF